MLHKQEEKPWTTKNLIVTTAMTSPPLSKWCFWLQLSTSLSERISLLNLNTRRTNAPVSIIKGSDMKGLPSSLKDKAFKLSPLYSEDGRLRVRKLHYRGCLLIATISIYYVHKYAPDYDVHYAVLVNTLFV